MRPESTTNAKRSKLKKLNHENDHPKVTFPNDLTVSESGHTGPAAGMGLMYNARHVDFIVRRMVFGMAWMGVGSGGGGLG